jgi:Uma2 family endonuclease
MVVFEPRPLRWTQADYYRLCEAEWFLERRVELIGGEIIEVSATTNVHASAVALTAGRLRAAFGADYWVRQRGSLDLLEHSVADLDVAVVRGAVRAHVGANNPRTALLVVEVSDTTLGYDRNAKASLYAAAGIADYWIVNLVQRQLEVYRDPIADAAQPFGFRYAQRTILDPGDHIAPLAAPQASVAVADLLP